MATLGHVRGRGPLTKSVGGVERSETILKMKDISNEIDYVEEKLYKNNC